MAFDEVRQRVVLFGGFSASGSYLGDTWEWDGVNWLPRFSTTAPPARGYHTIVYDSLRHRVVLFGGRSSLTNYLADTWEWDGTDWQHAPTVSAPAPRYSHSAAFNSATGVVVLFGGADAAGTLLSDTWSWNGSQWALQSSAVSPPSRYAAAMSCNPATQSVILFGGLGTAGNLSDTWAWDGQWTQVTPAASPQPRNEHAMAFDAQMQRVVMIGGVPQPETWVFGAPVGASAVASDYGQGCGSPALTFTTEPFGRPVLGQTASATSSASPTSLAAVALGWDDQFFGPYPLPVTLTGIGMTGCDLLTSADAIGLGTSSISPTAFRFDLQIPNQPSLIGGHAYLQAYAYAPGANPLQIIISNGVHWQFGDI